MNDDHPNSPAGRRAEDRDEIQARSAAWAEFQRRSAERIGDLGSFDAFLAALRVYREQLTVAAVRRMGRL